MAIPHTILAQFVAQAGDLTLYQIHKTSYPVSVITCYVLEAIATLPDEMRYVWPSDWSLMKMIYFFNKYSPFVDIVLLVQVDITSHDADACALQFQLLTYWLIVGVLCSEFILIVRTYALWGGDRHILYFNIYAAALMTPHAFYVAYDMLRINLKSFGDDAQMVRILGCMPAINDFGVWPAFVYMICAELMVVLSTLLKRYLDHASFADGSSRSSILLTTLYRDGTWFWAVVLVFSVVNLLMMFLAPRELSFLLQESLRTVHSALCTRVLLNLRKAAASTSYLGVGEFTVNTMALESLPMFAPLGEEEFEMEIVE
ncbi:hypothetical protein BD310DRAFT_828155 [Dichomitus squalens]|uniref:DUF6533 domain-containing protein n=1 Tax=Dichomitus squalens TaxID=114155 RepID=A0A4Q9PJV3_9APHY|nr:hypothetical protein BD310DRAFT_828155 [Dichomitus squalens]